LRMGTSRRRQLSITLKMAAIFGPASLLPKCSQFFLLWKYLHSRNYVHSQIMCSLEAKRRVILRIDEPLAQITALDRCA
jgi:hypothetical protein